MGASVRYATGLGTQIPFGPAGRGSLSREETPWVKNVASGVGKAVVTATGIVLRPQWYFAALDALVSEVAFERALLDGVVVPLVFDEKSSRWAPVPKVKRLGALCEDGTS